MQTYSLIPKDGESITLPFYDLWAVAVLVALRCFKCGSSCRVWIGGPHQALFVPRCCGRLMWHCSAAPFGNANLN